MTKKLKLSLYLQPVEVDGQVTYEVNPGSEFFQDNEHHVHVWQHDPLSIFRLKVNFQDRQNGVQSHLKISQIMLEDIDITDTLQFCGYRRHDTNELLPGTYGYMSHPGVYSIPVRYAPLLHRYVMNFYRVSYRDDSKHKDLAWPPPNHKQAPHD